MGKSAQHNAAAELEFSNLERLLVHTADEAAKCLKTLKDNLVEYDKRHRLLFLNTSKSFMRSDIRSAKDKASELKQVADQITKTNKLSEWEITIVRSKIHEVSDTLLNLKRSARAYDRKNNMERIPEMEPNTKHIRSNQDIDRSESEGSWFSEDNNRDRSGSSMCEGIDSVEAVVKSTVHQHFSGFSALKHQVSIAEDSLAPSFADRFMDTMNSMSNSLKGATFYESDTTKKSVSV